jgi:hypothetical protein
MDARLKAALQKRYFWPFVIAPKADMRVGSITCGDDFAIITLPSAGKVYWVFALVAPSPIIAPECKRDEASS